MVNSNLLGWVTIAATAALLSNAAAIDTCGPEKSVTVTVTATMSSVVTVTATPSGSVVGVCAPSDDECLKSSSSAQSFLDGLTTTTRTRTSCKPGEACNQTSQPDAPNDSDNTPSQSNAPNGGDNGLSQSGAPNQGDSAPSQSDAPNGGDNTPSKSPNKTSEGSSDNGGSATSTSGSTCLAKTTTQSGAGSSAQASPSGSNGSDTPNTNEDSPDSSSGSDNGNGSDSPAPSSHGPDSPGSDGSDNGNGSDSPAPSSHGPDSPGSDGSDNGNGSDSPAPSSHGHDSPGSDGSDSSENNEQGGNSAPAGSKTTPAPVVSYSNPTAVPSEKGSQVEANYEPTKLDNTVAYTVKNPPAVSTSSGDEGVDKDIARDNLIFAPDDYGKVDVDCLIIVEEIVRKTIFVEAHPTAMPDAPGNYSVPSASVSAAASASASVGAGGSDDSTSQGPHYEDGDILTPISTNEPAALFKRQDNSANIDVSHVEAGNDKNCIHTNKFYENAIVGKQSEALYAQPYTVWWNKMDQDSGLGLAYFPNDRRYEEKYFYHILHKPALTLSANEFSKDTTKMQVVDPDTHSTTIRLHNSENEAAEFPIVLGMGFVSGKYNGVTPRILAPAGITKIERSGGSPSASNSTMNGAEKRAESERVTERYEAKLTSEETWVIYVTKNKGDDFELIWSKEDMDSDKIPSAGSVLGSGASDSVNKRDILGGYGDNVSPVASSAPVTSQRSVSEPFSAANTSISAVASSTVSPVASAANSTSAAISATASTNATAELNGICPKEGDKPLFSIQGSGVAKDVLIQVAIIKEGIDAEKLHGAAGMCVTGVDLKASVQSNKAQYSLVYRTEGNSECGSPLVFALPHHVASFVNDLKNVFVGELESTVKGKMQGYLTSSLDMQEELHPELGMFPVNPKDLKPSQLNLSTIAETLNVEMTQDFNRAVPPGQETFSYWYGKVIDKFAYMTLIASDIIQQKNVTETLLKRTTEALDVFTQNKQAIPFIYDTKYCGITAERGGLEVDYGFAQYNSHHLHYGYFIHAAAIVGYVDKQMGGDWLEKNKDWVNDIIRSTANPSKEDTYFPVFRTFDFFHGHSWAAGLYEFDDGRNEQSTSEDVNFAYAMKIWASLIEDKKMEARADLMLSILARSINSYVLLKSDNQIVPKNMVDKKVVGVTWENKLTYETFFGQNIEWVHGVQMLPLTPASILTRDPQFCKEEWTSVLENHVGNVNDGYRGILQANQALFDAKSSLEFFSGVDLETQNSYIDSGSSLSWYLTYAGMLQAAQGDN